MVDRRALARRAMHASITARQTAKLDLFSPICVYDMARTLGVQVRFNDLHTMEGMYQRGAPPRIHLSAMRPLFRRSFTCGHELGHHFFGHGSTIDELQDDRRSPSEKPEEILADAFAAFVLMPTLGLRRAFATRGLKPETATASQIYTVACEFGVGYRTLVTHLAYGIEEISRNRASELLRTTPQAIRSEFLGGSVSSALIIADERFASPTLDAEVGTFLLLPTGVMIGGVVAQLERNTTRGSLYRCVNPGIARAGSSAAAWSVFIRVSRKNYVGLASYRHLEEENE